MNLLASFAVALDGLAANKMRSALTVLGIVIGVAAVIALMAVGKGAQASVTGRIQGLGTNLLFVRPGAATEGGVRGAQGSAPTLTLEDAEALASPSGAPAVALVAPEVSAGGQVIAEGVNLNTRVLGVTPEYGEVRNFVVADGEFIARSHVEARSLVAVLGAKVARDLFGEDSPIGRTLRLNRQQYRVIGVLEAKGGTGFGSQDDVVVLPITTVQTRLQAQRTARGSRNVQSINVQMASAEVKNEAVEQISTILRERHRLSGQDDFTITSQEDTVQALNQVTGVFTAFLGSIAGISLLVGGIGIMNIMLVSVTERTREIGIRKAVGAKRRDILGQFLVEATFLSATGGLVGIGLGWGLSRLASGINIQGTPLQAVVSPDVVVLAFGVSVAIGLFFGIYPAMRASRLDPIEALRYE